MCFRPERELAGSDFHRQINRALQGTHTNHLERSLRPIPMGKKNYLFAWTEIGAERIGVIQSLLVTCRLHGVDPYTYLVDVLQRISEHPASQVIDLTPRIWKTKFAGDPMKSDLALAAK